MEKRILDTSTGAPKMRVWAVDRFGLLWGDSHRKGRLRLVCPWSPNPAAAGGMG